MEKKEVKGAIRIALNFSESERECLAREMESVEECFGILGFGLTKYLSTH